MLGLNRLAWFEQPPNIPARSLIDLPPLPDLAAMYTQACKPAAVHASFASPCAPQQAAVNAHAWLDATTISSYRLSLFQLQSHTLACND